MYLHKWVEVRSDKPTSRNYKVTLNDKNYRLCYVDKKLFEVYISFGEFFISQRIGEEKLSYYTSNANEIRRYEDGKLNKVYKVEDGKYITDSYFYSNILVSEDDIFVGESKIEEDLINFLIYFNKLHVSIERPYWIELI